MKALVLLPIRLYRAVISPFLGPRCRFYPTCSAYGLEAVERHGVLRGGLLALARLLRCHPWHTSGFDDPVPERFDWRGVILYKKRTENMIKDQIP